MDQEVCLWFKGVRVRGGFGWFNKDSWTAAGDLISEVS